MINKYKNIIQLIWRWINFFLSIGLFILISIMAINYKSSIYLYFQAKGQFSILFNQEPLSQFIKNNKLSPIEKENYLLIEKVKSYSVDSFGFNSTNNFLSIYNQQNTQTLMVLTASHPFQLKPYEWFFPIIGKVSYKGFFDKKMAIKESNHLISLGYDVELRNVSAWSTLGWFNDPILSNLLKLKKGDFCNLLFHELFHATYYAKNKVDFNENIANFVAHKATLQFLSSDTLALQIYITSHNNNLVFKKYILSKAIYLSKFYTRICNKSNKYQLKLKAIIKIADSLIYLPHNNLNQITNRKNDILKSKNAFFIDFQQYDSMQDSLEVVFNKIYKSKLKKMVLFLKKN